MDLRYALWVAVGILLVSFTVASSETEKHGENNATNEEDYNSEHNGTKEGHDDNHGGVHLVQWNIEHVAVPITITLAVLLVGFAKLGFHKFEVLSTLFPESALLIVVGTALGGISYVSKGLIFISFDETTFFLYLLPPIILESAYSLFDRFFSSNLGTILIYAVIGSLLNFGLIGGSLYGVCAAGACGSFQPTIWQCLAFSALISALDTGDVLVIFQKIQVNNRLYFLVLGESLLNDAVAVVLYNLMVAFIALPVIPASQVVLGIFSFLTITLGGLVVGIIIGMLSAFMTKFTKHVRVVEPLTILGMAYLSYIVAELFHWSGIISIIGCGLVQCQYAFANICRKSNIAVNYSIKVLSMTSESIILVSLGQTMWDNEMVWNSGFILLTLAFCFLFRCFSVSLLTRIANMNRLYKITKEEQFIMSYGGLRGAVAYALVIQLDTGEDELNHLFVTCTLAVVFFTVFIQGCSIKPLVNCFRIRKQVTQKPTMCEEVNRTVIDFMMAGIEEVAGQKGDNYLRLKFEYYDEKYLKKWLQRNPETRETHMMALYEQIALKDHREHIFDIAKAPQEDEACPVRRLCTLERAISVDIGELEHQPTHYQAYQPIKGNSSIDDLRKLWRNNPSTSMHLPCDKNLKEDDKQDLAVQLRQQQCHYMAVKKRNSSMYCQSGIDDHQEDDDDDEGGIVIKFEPSIKRRQRSTILLKQKHMLQNDDSVGYSEGTDIFESTM